jgi:hypothetical protein
MERYEVDMQTRERKTVQLTQAEIDEANIRAVDQEQFRLIQERLRLQNQKREAAIEAALEFLGLSANAPAAITDYLQSKGGR